LQVGIIDYLIIGVYFTFVIGIGFALKKQMVNSEEFFLSGRSIPSWITGLAFISANLGAVEVMGMASSGAKYGIMTAHYYWIGAIPAMLFLAIFMMPFYYGSKIHSVPEYLKRRYNEPTRALNAISFAFMTILMSGINMYAMALVLKLLLNWDMNLSILTSAAVVLAYTVLGGLTSSIYNEVLQFFLIVFGFLPLTILGLDSVGGWAGLCAKLPNAGYSHLWAQAGTVNNPMGIEWLGLAMGLGFVLSFGYWCTDFLVIQRALAAEDMQAAQRTPLIAAIPKVLFPAITVVPGMLAVALIPGLGTPGNLALSYDQSLPLMLSKFYPQGMLGVGLTAMLASFMSGMAGNITAFNTVWTYDIYKSYIAKEQTDKHYLWMGRAATAAGIVVSIGAAYIAMHFPDIMDYMQTIFGFFNAPLFATFLLGMFWKKTTPWGGFWGLVSGILAAAISYFVLESKDLHLLVYSSAAAANFWRATIAWTVCFLVTIAVSLFTPRKPESELAGLVWGQGPVIDNSGVAFHKRPVVIAVFVLILALTCNIIFW
jgi:SSS family solute:Na+ symporter